MLTHGPWKPSVNESRPAAIEVVPPVAAYTLEPPADIAWKSALVTPKKTPVLLSRVSEFWNPQIASAS